MGCVLRIQSRLIQEDLCGLPDLGLNGLLGGITLDAVIVEDSVETVQVVCQSHAACLILDHLRGERERQTDDGAIYLHLSGEVIRFSTEGKHECELCVADHAYLVSDGRVVHVP